MAFSLLENAIASIECGIEDYETDEDKRVISSIRNLFAGVLLLLKARLHDADPLLIAAKIKPAVVEGKIEWQAKGLKTVDFHEIQEHWKVLGWSFDWKRLEALRNIRNAIEHHKVEHPVKVLQEAVVNTFVLVVKAFELLQLDAGGQLEESVWQTMLEEAATFRELADECRESREVCPVVPDIAGDAFIHHARCPHCQSELLKATDQDAWPDTGLTCIACGAIPVALDILPDALVANYPEDNVDTCPHCYNETFVVSESLCAACGEGLHYTECYRCTEPLGPADQDNDGLCGYCSHMSAKLDKE